MQPLGEKAVVKVQGATISGCSIVNDKAKSYVEMKWGSVQTEAISFGLEFASFFCTSDDYKALPIRMLEYVGSTAADTAKELVMIPLKFIEDIGTKCMDWSELVTVYREGENQYVQLPLKEVKAGDRIMTVNGRNEVDFTTVFLVSLHSSSVPVLQLTVQPENASLPAFQHRITPPQHMYVNRDGQQFHIASFEVRPGDKLYYVPSQRSIAAEFAVVTSVEPMRIEGLAHIWTDSMSHCANGLLTSTMVEGDWRVKHWLVAASYRVHHAIPAMLYQAYRDWR